MEPAPLLSEISSPPPRSALLLGYAGLLPFVASCGASWWLGGARQASAQFILLAYGASILSFIGAIHWGLAASVPHRISPFMLTWGVVPSLLAWVALVAGAQTGLPLLVVGLWACFAVDRRMYPRYGLRGWLGMRLALTCVASVSCIVAALAPMA